MSESIDAIAEEILNRVDEKQQISYNELSDAYFSRGVPKDTFDLALRSLEERNMIASRNTGGILTYYLLDRGDARRVVIVEDDKNINRLMAIALGKGLEITQVYDGGEAISTIRKTKPNLVVLDLMLPHKDGLDICNTIKSDPQISGTTVVIVSAMDPTSNRFKGIKYGADYYIKKPFDPKELRALVNIFLRKKGKRFDPLIDLPDEERLSKEFERSIKEGNEYVLGTLRVEHLGEYATRFGPASAMVILRLVSQLMQDSIRSNGNDVFIGFLNSNEFVIAGPKGKVSVVVSDMEREFESVLPFILQDVGFKPLSLDIASLFEAEELPRLSILFSESLKRDRIAKREEVLRNKGTRGDNIGSYTYEELQKMLGSGDLNIVITRDSTGIRLRVGKEPVE